MVTTKPGGLSSLFSHLPPASTAPVGNAQWIAVNKNE
jgi:hypothetical protein